MKWLVICLTRRINKIEKTEENHSIFADADYGVSYDFLRTENRGAGAAPNIDSVTLLSFFHRQASLEKTDTG